MNGARLVIDGPALAHHIYYRLRAQPDGSDGLIDDLPSYTQLGRSILGYLDALEDSGLIV